MSSPTTKPRDYLFDNCKAFLILMVVLGHFTEGSYQHTDFLYTLKWLIVSFHMPAFIFISGYFSKRELSLSALIWKLGVPYLVYEVVYYLLYTHQPGADVPEVFALVHPGPVCLETCDSICKKNPAPLFVIYRGGAFDRVCRRHAQQFPKHPQDPGFLSVFPGWYVL